MGTVIEFPLFIATLLLARCRWAGDAFAWGGPFCQSKKLFLCPDRAKGGAVVAGGGDPALGCSGPLLSPVLWVPCPWVRPPHTHPWVVMEDPPLPSHPGSRRTAGPKSPPVDTGGNPKGGEKSDLSRRRDARRKRGGWVLEGWSSTVAVQRIPLCSQPQEVWATVGTGCFQSTCSPAGISAMEKPCNRLSRHPGRCFPLGFIAWSSSRHRRMLGGGDRSQLLGEQQDRAVSPAETCPAGLSCPRGSGMGGGGSWGPPWCGAGCGDPSRAPSRPPHGLGAVAALLWATSPCSEQMHLRL